MNRKLDTIVITVALIAYQYMNYGFASESVDENHERSKRFVFLKTAGIGYLVALAVPTSAVNRQRVYMAFNFEAHYNLADNETVLQKFKMPFPGDDISKLKREVHGMPVENRIQHFRGDHNVYSRKNFYRILEKEINTHGYNGTACLLRTICETSETPLYENNGVFGNIFHILFTPTSSKAEKIRSTYYEAEYYGKIQECHRYFDNCNISFLDLVSDLISIESRKIM